MNVKCNDSAFFEFAIFLMPGQSICILFHEDVFLMCIGLNDFVIIFDEIIYNKFLAMSQRKTLKNIGISSEIVNIDCILGVAC